MGSGPVSLLWTQAMAWHQEPDDHTEHNPIHVRKAGFAGLVGDSEYEQDWRESADERDPHDKNPWESGYDEDLRDETAPELTPEEETHLEEHGDHPDSYYERHDNAYLKAHQEKQRKAREEDTPDHEDPELMRFVREHGSNTSLWQNKGHLGHVNLKEPVYATQTHVSDHHLSKYRANPKALTWHRTQHGPVQNHHYLGDDTPLFVTHEGRLHAIEGHHRVAAALQAGHPHIHAWHFDLDKHPKYGQDPDEDEDY